MVRTLIVISTLVVHIFAQPAANPNQPPPGGGQQKPAEPPKKKSMEEALKNKKEIPGFFTLYQDTTSGKLFMLVKKDQLNKEYIHFVHGLNGQLNAGVFKGSYGGAKVIKLNRYFNRIEFEVENLEIAVRIGWCESRGKGTAYRKEDNDSGVMQFIPSTWNWIAEKNDLPRWDEWIILKYGQPYFGSLIKVEHDGMYADEPPYAVKSQ